MHVLLLSPYHGGSHQAWAEGYAAHSAHEVRLLTLPARFWKWRMHGGALTLARLFSATSMPKPDVLLATDMLDLTTFLALTRHELGSVPAVLYMHENQLTYPLRGMPRRRRQGYQLNARERHFGFINLSSMLAADAVWFNSAFHRRTWFRALPRFLKHYPEYNELERIEQLRKVARVMPVGIDLRRLKEPPVPPDPSLAPLVLWNQRWEYDKNPAAFFRALYDVLPLPFRVALCGENFRRQPSEFEEARARLGDRIVHVGYADPVRYSQLLHEATVTLSTAHHEYFGISILEAIYCRTLPLLPQRLSYPELIPHAFHRDVFYRNYRDLGAALSRALLDPDAARRQAARLAPHAARYDWSQVAPRYDAALSALRLKQASSDG